MTDIAKRVLDAEEIEPEDDTPEVGEWYEVEWTEEVSRHPSNRDGLSDDFFDCDGPVVKVATVQEEDEDHWERVDVTRRVLVCVTKVGSNFAEVTSVGGNSERIHLDEFHARCKQVDDADARIATGVGFWQRQLEDASKTVSALMGEVGLSGRQLAPATAALAVAVGSKPAEEYKTQLARLKEDLPSLYKSMEDAGKQMGRWMAAKAIPLKADGGALKAQIDAIDRRLFAVDLYCGLSEGAEQVREGEAAGFAEPLHVMQGLRFMDEEAVAHYQAGGITFDSIRRFDAWIASTEHFDRLFPFPRCVVAFRVRRHDHPYEGVSAFVRIFLHERDRVTFLYVRNGDQLWRVHTPMKFGSRLYPDREHSKFSLGQALYCTNDGDVITEAEYLARVERDSDLGADERYRWSWDKRTVDKYRPFDSTNVYFDDVSAKVAKDVEEFNRVAVLLQGLFDRSAILHPHPPIKMWDATSFNRSVRLVYEADRAVTAGPAPEFEEYAARLREALVPGSWTIGQRKQWIDAEHKRVQQGGRKRWRWDDPGPKHIDKIVSIKKGKASFEWERKSQRREAVGFGYRKRYEDKFITDSIAVDVDHLFNVSAYKPGDFRQFFEDPRTRAGYMRWAPFLLAAEEFHAGRENGAPVFPPEPEPEPEPDYEDAEAQDEADDA